MDENHSSHEEDDEEEKNQVVIDPMAALEDFGKADPHILKVYDMVC